MAPGPISDLRLKQITDDACNSTLSNAETYVHSQTSVWNTSIINNVLQKVISESTPSGQNQPPYKFAVNSTIVQHTEPQAGVESKDAGRRGMHSATGAFWNEDKDGMWSYKYEAGDSKGMDVVISVFWFSV
ncbi:hypothetical protein EJ05DRAFT_484400 [Pseudovirgaria hyperparasitica]|uniref:Tctex-1 n=1 Tax=Pseudovirgaria hyperparasitica TaxID=470096 RepID=A0A6A6WC76_9PEZI|nr:uncharacterized protein EJ05DRAFT_484400 [Pseudovirgaria hyperparasitica]KAF2759446.1 hypothetical protein EJ05DRAFT_484400 [Pseudovirgaria hyperparasitica]